MSGSLKCSELVCALLVSSLLIMRLEIIPGTRTFHVKPLWPKNVMKSYLLLIQEGPDPMVDSGGRWDQKTLCSSSVLGQSHICGEMPPDVSFVIRV